MKALKLRFLLLWLGLGVLAVRANSDSETAALIAAEEEAVLVGGDALMTPLQFATQYQNVSFFAGGLLSESTRWPNGIIPYTLESTNQKYRFQPSDEATILSAMDEWMSKTCVKFVPIRNPRASRQPRINIRPHQIDLSGIGFAGKSHYVYLTPKTVYRIALHELGHTLGLQHEQCRSDRDKHVVILTQNVGAPGQFQKSDKYSAFETPYDYCSIMHYDGKAFTTNSREYTIVTRDQNYQNTIGTTEHLSFYDAQVINKMYRCNKNCPHQASCVSPCYVDHKCKCSCPTSWPVDCPKKPCADTSPQNICSYYAKRQECERVKVMCQKTCGVCDQLQRIAESGPNRLISSFN